MYLLWIGVIAVALKFFEVGPFATIEWWWILAPLGLAFLWFEIFEKMFGFDKRKVDAAQWEKSRKDRVKASFQVKGPKGRAKAP
jgi:small Trp-rich protein